MIKEKQVIVSVGQVQVSNKISRGRAREGV
jgi:hypothetical protein